MRSRLMSCSWRRGTSESAMRGDKVTMRPSTNLMAWVRMPSLSESSSRMMSAAMADTMSQQASWSSLMTRDFTIHCEGAREERRQRDGDKTSTANSITTQRPIMMMNKFIWETCTELQLCPRPRARSHWGQDPGVTKTKSDSALMRFTDSDNPE